MLHREEPLLAETRLYGSVLIALAIAYLIVVILNLLHEAGILQIFGNLLADIHAVHSYVERTLVGNGTIGIEDINGFQIVVFSQLVVVYIVCRCNLQTACSEFYIYITVFNNGNYTVYQWHDYLMTAQPLVLGVLGVDTHSGIAHNGLGTCGSNNGIIAFLILVDDIVVFFRIFRNYQIFRISYIILQVEQVALLVSVDNLLG